MIRPVSLLALAGLLLGCEPPLEREGRRIFLEVAQPPCGICHTLKHAGTAGKVGPNLDELRPQPERVIRAVTGGVGTMPSQAEVLSEEQIRRVADYVQAVAGR